MTLTIREQRVAALYGHLHGYADVERAARYLLRGLRAHLETLGLDPDSVLRGRSFLDAGCGGFAGGAMAAVALGARPICAVDLSAANVASARRLLADVPGSLVSQQNLRSIGLAANTFDFVYCNGVLHHTEDPTVAFSELVRVLKPGGRLYVGIYSRGGLYNEVAVPMLRLLGRLIPQRLTEAGLQLLPSLLQPRSSLLDVMYVAIQSHHRRDEVAHWCANVGVTPVFMRHYAQPEGRLGRFVFGEGSMMFVTGVKPAQE